MERAARAAVRAARAAPPREARVATHMDTAAVRAAREAKSRVVVIR